MISVGQTNVLKNNPAISDNIMTMPKHLQIKWIEEKYQIFALVVGQLNLFEPITNDSLTFEVWRLLLYGHWGQGLSGGMNCWRPAHQRAANTHLLYKDISEQAYHTNKPLTLVKTDRRTPENDMTEQLEQNSTLKKQQQSVDNNNVQLSVKPNCCRWRIKSIKSLSPIFMTQFHANSRKR